MARVINLGLVETIDGVPIYKIGAQFDLGLMRPERGGVRAARQLLRGWIRETGATERIKYKVVELEDKDAIRVMAICKTKVDISRE